MTSDDKSNVTALPVKPKPRPEDDQDKFFVIKSTGCQHRGTFTFDEKEETVECKDCGQRLNPMYVIKMLAREETRWHEARSRYREEMKRLAKRSRTTCEHCNRTTKISRT